MPRRTAARYSAPALEKGLDVLELLASQPHALSLQEIAQRLGRSSAELYRMLDVLVQRGWLARLADASYGLTLRLFELAHRLFDQFGVVAALNVVYLKQRDARVTVPYARRALMETAHAVSRSLGWTQAA